MDSLNVCMICSLVYIFLFFFLYFSCLFIMLIIITRKGGNWEIEIHWIIAIWWPPDAAPVALSCFGQILRRMDTNCHFPPSDQNSDIAIRFSNHDVLKQSSNLAIRRRYAVTFSFDYLTLNVWNYLWFWPITQSTISDHDNTIT